MLFELTRTDFPKTALLLLTAGTASLRWMDWGISGAENTAGKSLSAILKKKKGTFTLGNGKRLQLQLVRFPCARSLAGA